MIHPRALPFSLLALAACGGGGVDPGSSTLTPQAGVELQGVEYGRLVDVYGYRVIDGKNVIQLHQTDVVVGPDIIDERPISGALPDSAVETDFINSNPDTLQPRLLIPRELGSAAFADIYARLDDKLRRVAPSQFGRSNQVAAYSVVPRNAAIRLSFSGALGIDDSFFYETDAEGKVTGFRNTGAVQLLRIVGNPNDTEYDRDFEQVAARIAVRGDKLIIDPVLLGSEGLTYGVRNSAAGMPAAADQLGANMRIALALDGPLRIPTINADANGNLEGRNNAAIPSVIRDFRSGHPDDNSADFARGFLRDSQPPRIIGAMPMYLERVETIDAETRLLTIYKGPFLHELDQTDIIRLVARGAAAPAATVEVLEDPVDDRGRPEVERVRVRVRAVFDLEGRDVLEAMDPANLPGYPAPGAERDAFLVREAPKAVVVAEYTHRRAHPDPGIPFYGDDPRYFLSFNPTPLPDPTSGVLIANERVSPFAGAVVRFSKPVDMNSLVALDTVFFGTRNLLDRAEIDEFITARNIDPAAFNEAKFRTPHLIHSRIFDEDGSQTTVRVQPTLGFYLDEAMRQAYEADRGKPFAERRYHYHLHLVGGLQGVRDLAGNPLDFQAENLVGEPAVESVVMPFELDGGRDQNGKPNHADNLAVYVVRRFADEDEDERPSYYMDDEIMKPGVDRTAISLPYADLFGPVSYLEDGTLVTRPASRVRATVDSLNQVSAPPQTDPVLRWCPATVSGNQIIFQTAASAFGQPIQNPLNPYGCRLQMVWRDVDMSLSRTDPSDFNLDVEQMYWAPFTGSAIVFDEFDRVTMYLGHSEYRPEPCINTGSAFPSMPNSGLRNLFADNYANNLDANREVGERPAPHPAFVDRQLTISAKDAITERNGVFRYLPLPSFEDATKISGLKNPYFVWRDEQVYVQGGDNSVQSTRMQPYPYLLGPFLAGRGQRVIDANGTTYFQAGRWYNGTARNLSNGSTDTRTGGQVGALGLPLLADFWVYPDSAGLPTYDPFLASGANGWQISVAVGSAPTPFFRAVSSGRSPAINGQPQELDTTSPEWARASGGWSPVTGGRTRALDNTVYWVMADFLKRTAVVTSGFVELANPHRVELLEDPRLGPFDLSGKLPSFVQDFEPGLDQLPAGTKVVAEFRGAGALAQSRNFWPEPQVARQATVNNQGYPNPVTAKNFANDPLKAGDAHIHQWDDRSIPGTSQARDHWVYMYHDKLTRYTEDPNELVDPAFTNSFSGPNENFDPSELRYFNWRFIMQNNADASPPVSPSLQSYSVAYRLQTTR